MYLSTDTIRYRRWRFTQMCCYMYVYTCTHVLETDSNHAVMYCYFVETISLGDVFPFTVHADGREGARKKGPRTRLSRIIITVLKQYSSPDSYNSELYFLNVTVSFRYWLRHPFALSTHERRTLNMDTKHSLSLLTLMTGEFSIITSKLIFDY